MGLATIKLCLFVLEDEKISIPFRNDEIDFVLLVIVAVYLNVVFARAEISYNKKRGNQRIEEQPNKSYFEKRKEEKGRIEPGEVKLYLVCLPIMMIIDQSSN